MLKSDKLDMLLQITMEEMSFEELKRCDSIEKSPLKVSEQVIRLFYHRLKADNLKAFLMPDINAVKKIAVAVIVMLAVAFACVMSIEPLRAALFEAIVTWHDRYIAIYIEPDEGAEKYLGECWPTYLPEGWSIMGKNENLACSTLDIVGPKGEYIFFQHIKDYNDEFWMSNDTETFEEIRLIDGTVAYLAYYKEDDFYNLYWVKETSAFCISGFDTDSEILIKMAESVEKAE